MAKLVRAISDMGGVVIAALDSTDIVSEMERIHKPSAVVSAALGRFARRPHERDGGHHGPRPGRRVLREDLEPRQAAVSSSL